MKESKFDEPVMVCVRERRKLKKQRMWMKALKNDLARDACCCY